MQKIKKLLLFFFLLASTNLFAQSAADSMLNFIRQNKTRTSLYLQKNGNAIAALNENTLMPLASTVKILVAVEFAKQAAFKVFDENKYVSLKELDKYYLANTDGGAHPNWIKYETNLGNIKNDSARLIDIAKGMIIFSSNANTEFLMDLLGVDNVNGDIRMFGIKKHTPVYPLVSSLFLYQDPKNIKEDKIIEEIKYLNNVQYSKAISVIHNELKFNAGYKQKFRLQDLTVKMQKVWSDRLPASTTKDYVHMISILNNRTILDEKTYNVLSEVLETVMENPANKSWLDHAGMKGGSTMFVLTKAVYATLKDGTKIELAYFFNNLSNPENSMLQQWMNAFEIKVLNDESFRKKIIL
ncbi:MAG: serine hydrolase [Chitinophagaceae bacterium]|nr:serine hydrolase [Chitinophagaceae bacterium]